MGACSSRESEGPEIARLNAKRCYKAKSSGSLVGVRSDGAVENRAVHHGAILGVTRCIIVDGAYCASIPPLGLATE